MAALVEVDLAEALIVGAVLLQGPDSIDQGLF